MVTVTTNQRVLFDAALAFLKNPTADLACEATDALACLITCPEHVAAYFGYADKLPRPLAHTRGTSEYPLPEGGMRAAPVWVECTRHVIAGTTRHNPYLSAIEYAARTGSFAPLTRTGHPSHEPLALFLSDRALFEYFRNEVQAAGTGAWKYADEAVTCAPSADTGTQPGTGTVTCVSTSTHKTPGDGQYGAGSAAALEAAAAAAVSAVKVDAVRTAIAAPVADTTAPAPTVVGPEAPDQLTRFLYRLAGTLTLDQINEVWAGRSVNRDPMGPGYDQDRLNWAKAFGSRLVPASPVPVAPPVPVCAPAPAVPPIAPRYRPSSAVEAILVRAQNTADKFGDTCVSSRHLLYAILNEGGTDANGHVRQVDARVPLLRSLASLNSKWKELVGEFPPEVTPEPAAPPAPDLGSTTVRFDDVLRYTRQIANELGDTWLTTRHMLLAIVKYGTSDGYLDLCAGGFSTALYAKHLTVMSTRWVAATKTFPADDNRKIVLTNMSSQTQDVVRGAAALAGEHGEMLGTHHLLYRLVATDTPAAETLAKLGVTKAALDRVLHPHGTNWKKTIGDLPAEVPDAVEVSAKTTPLFQRVLVQARAVAVEQNDPVLDTLHVLYAMLNIPGTSVCDMFRVDGLGDEVLRRLHNWQPRWQKTIPNPPAVKAAAKVVDDLTDGLGLAGPVRTALKVAASLTRQTQPGDPKIPSDVLLYALALGGAAHTAGAINIPALRKDLLAQKPGFKKVFTADEIEQAEEPVAALPEYKMGRIGSLTRDILERASAFAAEHDATLETSVLLHAIVTGWTSTDAYETLIGAGFTRAAYDAVVAQGHTTVSRALAAPSASALGRLRAHLQTENAHGRCAGYKRVDQIGGMFVVTIADDGVCDPKGFPTTYEGVRVAIAVG